MDSVAKSRDTEDQSPPFFATFRALREIRVISAINYLGCICNPRRRCQSDLRPSPGLVIKHGPINALTIAARPFVDSNQPAYFTVRDVARLRDRSTSEPIAATDM